MMTRVRCLELSQATIQGTLQDSAGDPVAGADVTVCDLTLWDLETGAPGASPSGIINSRNGVDLLGSGEVTIDTVGLFIWRMQAADNPIVTSPRQVERHRATLHFEWDRGSPGLPGETNVEFEIEVENLRKLG